MTMAQPTSLVTGYSVFEMIGTQDEIIDVKTKETIIVVLISLVSVSLFTVFVPIVPETEYAPCYVPCGNSAFVIIHYSSLMSFHFFKVGAVFGACGGNYRMSSLKD